MGQISVGDRVSFAAAATTAAEQYDPVFAIKLSSCAGEAEATRLLDEWLARRMDVLKRTQARLRQVWKTAHPEPGSEEQFEPGGVE